MDPLSNFKERIEQYCFATYKNFLLRKHYDTVASIKSKNGQNMEVFAMDMMGNTTIYVGYSYLSIVTCLAHSTKITTVFLY